MMYTVREFKTKKEFKEAVKAGGVEVYSYNPMSRTPPVITGDETVCGPSEDNRRWYARIMVEQNVVTKVLA